MITTELIRRYRSFRGRTMSVGHDAEIALRRARAEMAVEELGLAVTREPEQERYFDVYGEDPPLGVGFYCVAIHAPEERYIASLGFVPDNDPQYMREVIADLYIEAIEILRARKEREACRQAEELSARATYAGVA